MRKRFYILMWLAVFVLFLSGIIPAQCKLNHPAPFQKAKELALTCPKNQYGNHIWQANFNDNGNSIEYQILCGSYKDENGHHDVVILIQIQGSAWVAIRHCGICDDYQVASNKTGGILVPVESKIAIQAGFIFFKELVEHKLI